MRRLTLILSDLYLPEEASGGTSIGNALHLPGLERLLRFARRRNPIDDWRTWLANELGRPAITRFPAAQFAARAVRAPGDLLRNAWLATPVALEARLDHVRLRDRGLLRTSVQERGRWCEDFAREFGPTYRLHDAGPRGFLLTGLDGADAATVDPARLLDCDVGHALPSASARELRRLGAEIEMWMHGAAANLARSDRGLPVISTLWLWGGGRHEPEPPGSLVLPASVSTTVVTGDDPWLAALSPAITGRLAEQAPTHCSALADSAEHSIVELAPMSGTPAESLVSLETGWFTPMRAALESGALHIAEIVANDVCFRIARRSSWRFWRRRRGWVESLMRPEGDAKA